MVSVLLCRRVSAWASQALMHFQQHRKAQGAGAAALKGLTDKDKSDLATAAAAAPLEDLLL